MKKLLLVFSLSALVANFGFSEVFSYSYTARVAGIWGTSFFGAHPVVDEHFTGYFTFDTATSFSIATANSGTVVARYNQSPPQSFGFTLRGLNLQSDTGYIFSVANYISGAGKEIKSFQLYDVDRVLKLNGTIVNNYALGYDLAFTVQNPNPYPSLDLPTNSMSASDFSFAHGTVNADGYSGITYDIISMTVVPEPAIGALCLSGYCLLWLKRKHVRQ